MVYLLSVALFPVILFSFGICVGQMESFVHTIYFDSKSVNTAPFKSYLMMTASTIPWYLSFVLLHVIENYLLSSIPRKQLCQLLLVVFAGGLYFALAMSRKNIERVACGFALLQTVASAIFGLIMSLINDISKQEGGLSKRIIVFGPCLSALNVGTGIGRTVLTGFVYYRFPLWVLQYSYYFVLLALVLMSVKFAPKTGEIRNRALEARKKDDELEPLLKGSRAGSKTKDSKPPAKFFEKPPSFAEKMRYIIPMSRGLVLYMSVRQLPSMLISWKVAPDYLSKLGFNPLLGLLGLPVFTLLATAYGSFICALFVSQRNLLKMLKISSLTASLLLLPFMGLPLNVSAVRAIIAKCGLGLIMVDSIFSGFETGLVVLYFLEINAQLPLRMRLCHLGLFVATDHFSTHMLYTLLSTLGDNYGASSVALILLGSIAVNCIACVRIR